MKLYRDNLGKIEIDYEQEKVCKDAARELREKALEIAMRIGAFEADADKTIENAIKIEAYLRGELRGPDDL